MSERFRPLVALTRARLLEILREPGVVFWVFGFPVLMAVLLGLAFRSRPPQAIPVAIDGPATAWVLDALTAAQGINAEAMSGADAADVLRRGKVDLRIEAADDERGALPRLTYHYDPTRPQSEAARLAVDDALQRAAGRADAIVSDDVTMTAKGSRYIDFLIPGLLGLNLMSSSMWGIGFAVVMMRSGKLLKRFAATPMRRSDYFLSLMASRLVLLIFEVTFLVAFGWLVFDVAVRGSLMLLFSAALLGAAAFAGIGLVTAARTKTVEVVSGLMNVVMLPMWMVSGAFFSYERFPDILHPVIKALPLTALNDALRAITNDAAGVAEIAPELLILGSWTVVSFVVALKIFRWQ